MTVREAVPVCPDADTVFPEDLMNDMLYEV